jgi:hypothetical protein
MKRVRGSSHSRSSGRTPHNQSRGGRRVGAGARDGNLNGAKSLPWLESYDLTTPESIDLFLKELIRAVWEGRLGSRSGGCLNGSLRLLLEHLTLPALEKRISELEKGVLKV